MDKRRDHLSNRMNGELLGMSAWSSGRTSDQAFSPPKILQGKDLKGEFNKLRIFSSWILKGHSTFSGVRGLLWPGRFSKLDHLASILCGQHPNKCLETTDQQIACQMGKRTWHLSYSSCKRVCPYKSSSFVTTTSARRHRCDQLGTSCWMKNNIRSLFNRMLIDRAIEGIVHHDFGTFCIRPI